MNEEQCRLVLFKIIKSISYLDGTIIGIDRGEIDKLKKNFVTSMNNPLKINPTFYLTVEEVEIENKIILYIFVPESSQVHRCNGKIYDRNEDGDIDITD